MKLSTTRAAPPALTEDPFEVNEDLARWLQASGRRRLRPVEKALTKIEPIAQPGDGTFLDAARLPILLGLLAYSLGQYFFLATSLKILLLPSLVFFVFR
ncbi:MAG: hypothetical protein QOD26_1189 [Betaproteobacteria bacterium]|nr:hypothetical protein [Betaproteobacteria bacterium]